MSDVFHRGRVLKILWGALAIVCFGEVLALRIAGGPISLNRYWIFFSILPFIAFGIVQLILMKKSWFEVPLNSGMVGAIKRALFRLYVLLFAAVSIGVVWYFVSIK